MTKITEVKELPISSLVIGTGQVRVRDVEKEIDELAESIRKLGLLEPIIVCPAAEAGKYEILTGQRRFLAHQKLKKDTILAAILEQKVDETTAKVISVTENLVRRDLNSKDLIDACTALYRRYGTIKDVAEETGLPYVKVQEYVKYDRLHPKLRELVDTGSVSVKVALRAQDAASIGKPLNVEEAIKLAKEMAGMSGAQQDNIVKEREKDPTKAVDELIESSKTGAKITQIIVTIGAQLHQSLQKFAKDEQTTQDDAARSLIEEALVTKGYLSKEE